MNIFKVVYILMEAGDEKELALRLAIHREHGPKKQYMHTCTCKTFAGRTQSGGARKHYASEISDRKLPHTRVQ